MIAYRREIDGLRAVAIVPVVFFHAGFSAFQGGFVGVDVFFVISGYLITSIILRDLERGQFSFAHFFERRARRILPALFLVMALCIPAAHWLMLPDAFRDFAETAAAVALFVSNFLFIDRLDYFAPSAELNPLLHTWSLAVEEQFYILFPPVLFLAWRWGGWRAALWVSVALLIGSFALSEYLWRIYPAQTFFFFPTRAWEMLAGVLCAFGLGSDRARAALLAVPRLLREGIALAGLGAIVLAVVIYDKTVVFPSYATLLPVLGVVVLILFATADTLVARVLGWRGFVALGLISYSAYLWHQPLFAFARIANGAEPDLWLMLVLCALTIVLAAGSWWFVERPFRAGNTTGAAWLSTRAAVFSATGAGIVAFVGFGIWGLNTDGRASWWMAQATEIERQTFLVLREADQVARRSDNGACRLNVATLDDDTVARLHACRARYGPGVAVLGDSHAIDLAEGLLAISEMRFLFGLTRGGCRPDAPGNECSFDRFVMLVADKPDLFWRVIYESAGQHMVRDAAGRDSERLFSRFPPEGAIDLDAIFFRTNTIAAIGQYLGVLAQSVPVVWLTPRLEMHFPDRFVIARGCDHPFALRPGQAELFAQLSALVQQKAAGLPNVQVVDQQAQVDLQMPDDFLTCERSFWADSDHFSAAGRAAFSARLAPFLLASD